MQMLYEESGSMGLGRVERVAYWTRPKTPEPGQNIQELKTFNPESWTWNPLEGLRNTYSDML